MQYKNWTIDLKKNDIEILNPTLIPTQVISYSLSQENKSKQYIFYSTFPQAIHVEAGNGAIVDQTIEKLKYDIDNGNILLSNSFIVNHNGSSFITYE